MANEDTNLNSGNYSSRTRQSAARTRAAKRDLKTTMKGERLFLEAEHHEEMGDFKSAFKCLLGAAKLGHPLGQINLGNFYASGRGVKRSLEQAAHWYKIAYRKGYGDGAFNLAIDKRNAGNFRAAAVWFTKAIALKSGDACIELAKIYLRRKDGKQTAIDLLKQALRMGRDNLDPSAREQAESLLKGIAD